MQQVSHYVDAAYLQQDTPRPLAAETALNLLSDHVLARPVRTMLNPVFVISLAALLVLLVIKVPNYYLALPLGLIVGILLTNAYRVVMQAWADLRLLREGVIIRAHILKLRPNRTLLGEIEGALLDCAIVLTPRRTYVGSLWVADGNEALRLLRQGRLEVLCLPRTPGTWRVLEPIRSEIRYDRVGPAIAIPQDV